MAVVIALTSLDSKLPMATVVKRYFERSKNTLPTSLRRSRLFGLLAIVSMETIIPCAYIACQNEKSTGRLIACPSVRYSFAEVRLTPYVSRLSPCAFSPHIMRHEDFGGRRGPVPGSVRDHGGDGVMPAVHISPLTPCFEPDRAAEARHGQ